MPEPAPAPKPSPQDKTLPSPEALGAMLKAGTLTAQEANAIMAERARRAAVKGLFSPTRDWPDGGNAS